MKKLTQLFILGFTLAGISISAQAVVLPDETSEKVLVENLEDSQAPQESKDVVSYNIENGANLYATCIGCHGMKGEGGVGPQLQGQKKEDIISKVNIYKSGGRIGPMSGMMTPMVAGLTEDDVQDIAAYIATLE